MTISGRSDVLVVGAGPTGCAAGITLARAGCRVTVLDRATFPRDKTCGDAVSNDAAELLQRLGAWPRIVARAHAVVRSAAAVFPDGRRIRRDYARPGYIIPRLALDDALRLTLEESGAELIQRAKVSTLTRSGDRIDGAEGPDLSWRAPIVIAADGYGSVAWAALGQGKPAGRSLAVSATAYYQGVAFPHGVDVADHHFDRELPLGYGWIFPAVDGMANVGVYLRSDGYARAGKKLGALLDEFLERNRSRFTGATRAGKVRVWSLPLAPATIRVAAPGVLLAGDAGGFIDPLSGEGIWQGLHTGILAAEVAVRAVRSGELDDRLARQYAAACYRDVARPSRGKRLVQDGMDVVVRHGLYRLPPVRGALSLGYRHHLLEMTKS